MNCPKIAILKPVNYNTLQAIKDNDKCYEIAAPSILTALRDLHVLCCNPERKVKGVL